MNAYPVDILHCNAIMSIEAHLFRPRIVSSDEESAPLKLCFPSVQGTYSAGWNISAKAGGVIAIRSLRQGTRNGASALIQMDNETLFVGRAPWHCRRPRGPARISEDTVRALWRWVDAGQCHCKVPPRRVISPEYVCLKWSW